MGGVRRPRLGGTRRRAPPHQPAGGPDDGVAPPERLLVRHRARPRAERAAGGVPAQRSEVGAAQLARAAPPGAVARDARRPLERGVHRVPHDAGPDRLRHALPLGAVRRAGDRHHGGGVRHRLRVVPRPRRDPPRGQPQPPPALRTPPRARRRPDHRAAGHPRSGAVVAGLRAVPQRVGVLRRRGRAAGEPRGAALPTWRRAAGHAVHRPTRGRSNFGRKSGRWSPPTPSSSAARSGRTAPSGSRAASTTGCSTRPASGTRRRRNAP